MIKFTRNKETNIRRAWLADDAGNKVAVVAVLGTVSDLLSCELIFPDNVRGNEDKYLVIDRVGNIREFNTLDEAKTYVIEDM